jgi:uncharacterized protein (DUF4415 family)
MREVRVGVKWRRGPPSCRGRHQVATLVHVVPATLTGEFSTDPDDASELTEAWFAKADLYQGDKLIRRGGPPKKAAPKQTVNIRPDLDVLTRFRADGPGWQSRINAALRKAAGLE